MCCSFLSHGSHKEGIEALIAGKTLLYLKIDNKDGYAQNYAHKVTGYVADGGDAKKFRQYKIKMLCSIPLEHA